MRAGKFAALFPPASHPHDFVCHSLRGSPPQHPHGGSHHATTTHSTTSSTTTSNSFMADDLGQDWWLQEDAAEQRSDASEEEQEEHAKEDAEPTPKKSKKREKGGERPPEPGEPPSKGGSTKGGSTKQKVPRPEVAVPVIATEEEPKKKRKRKRKTITDVLAASEPARGTPEDLRQCLLAHFQGMLSVVEMEEMALSDASFLPSSDATHTVSSYLKEVCPKWAKLWHSHTDTKRPLAIVVCSSALRALDVMRQAAAFKGDCRVAKLFSKHIKVEEQIALLAKQPVHLAAGTPGRIKKILDLDGMTLDSLKYLVLDWNWRDQKLRRLIDIPEVKTDLLELLQKFIIPTARRSSAKIGLF